MKTTTKDFFIASALTGITSRNADLVMLDIHKSFGINTSYLQGVAKMAILIADECMKLRENKD